MSNKIPVITTATEIREDSLVHLFIRYREIFPEDYQRPNRQRFSDWLHPVLNRKLVIVRKR